jgi:hypothetical protein
MDMKSPQAITLAAHSATPRTPALASHESHVTRPCLPDACVGTVGKVGPNFLAHWFVLLPVMIDGAVRRG